MTDALCVATDAWGSHLDPGCPTSGRPLDELGLEPRGAEHLTVAEGDQAAGSELPAVDLAEKERTARALLALEDAVQLLCGSDVSGLGAFGSAPPLARGSCGIRSGLLAESTRRPAGTGYGLHAR